jgi:hypothetical protein
MIPSQKVSESTQVLRELAAKNKITTNHHPGDGFKTFSPIPKHVSYPEKFKMIIEKVNNVEIDE